MIKQGLLVLLVLVSLNCLVSNGQDLTDSVSTFRIETKDGNTFVGTIVSEDQLVIVLKTEIYGEVTIQKASISSRTKLGEIKMVGRELWLPNPQSARYFWAPNGYGLEKGSAYYQNIWILYNQFSFGLTRNFSIGAGMVPLFLFAGTATPLWIVPRFSIPVVENKLNIGTGALLATLIGEDTGLFGLLYGTTTIGSRERNISLGLAYGFADDEWLRVPVINFSGMARTGPRSYLITENYVITMDGETLVIISGGGRSMVRNVGIDYSLWIPLGADIDEFIAIPFLGITVPIRTKR